MRSTSFGNFILKHVFNISSCIDFSGGAQLTPSAKILDVSFLYFIHRLQSTTVRGSELSLIDGRLKFL